jgi:predicted aminopeptidase
MILNDKHDCIEHCTRILEQTSAWRKRKAAEFPDDARNAKAVYMLDQLAIDSANLSDEQWAELKPYFGWSSQVYREGLIQAAKMVGFAHRNRSFDSFVRLVVKQLPPLRVAA